MSIKLIPFESCLNVAGIFQDRKRGIVMESFEHIQDGAVTDPHTVAKQ